MLLILSARLVDNEIAARYGPLPPAFLPLGDRRVFTHQAALAREGERVVLTLPADFEIGALDQDALVRQSIEVVTQDSRWSITQAIRDVLDRDLTDGPLRIIYGDTLVDMGEHHDGDVIAVHHSTANYRWAYEDEVEGFSDDPPVRMDQRRIVCGFFQFTDLDLLRTACEEASIVDALRVYDAERPLTRAEASEWYDFGHLPLYLQSRRQAMVKRVFNTLDISDDRVLKSSSDTWKMRAEAAWFESLPTSLLPHAPRYLGRHEERHLAGYATEYVYSPLLSDVFVFGRVPLHSWLEVMTATFDMVDTMQSIRPPDGSPESSAHFAEGFDATIVRDKTRSRLARFLASSDLSLESRLSVNGTSFASLGEVVEEMLSLIPPTSPEDVTFWHGDLFYGNMFYDFTARRVLAIDPRGQTESAHVGSFGDRRYDLAKLAHSVVGLYDQILLNRATVEEDGLRWQLEIGAPEWHGRAVDIFLQQVESRYGLPRSVLLAMTASLFVSMLPLHVDHPGRQRQLLANALRVVAPVLGGQR